MAFGSTIAGAIETKTVPILTLAMTEYDFIYIKSDGFHCQRQVMKKSSRGESKSADAFEVACSGNLYAGRLPAQQTAIIVNYRV
jgi:hypothetical protein